jgi:hypothetical protein
LLTLRWSKIENIVATYMPFDVTDKTRGLTPTITLFRATSPKNWIIDSTDRRPIIGRTEHDLLPVGVPDGLIETGKRHPGLAASANRLWITDPQR